MDIHLRILKEESSNPFVAQTELFEMDSVSIQRISDKNYIVRFYDESKSFPSPHAAVMAVVTDDQSYFVYGYLARFDFNVKPKHHRVTHEFFSRMGLNPRYERFNH